jgi:hypothetical protein
MAVQPDFVEARMVYLAELAFMAEDEGEFQSAIRELRKIIREYAEHLRDWYLSTLAWPSSRSLPPSTLAPKVSW